MEDLGEVVQDVVGSCTAPFVDGLVIIADHHDICLASCQELDQALLSVVDVLVLVDDEVAYILAVALLTSGLVSQELHCQRDEVVEGQGIGG